MLLMLLVVLRITEPRCAFVGASVSEICFMVFGSVHAFASLPGSCHVLFVQLCVVYSKMAIFCFALLLLISFFVLLCPLLYVVVHFWVCACLRLAQR